MIIQKLIQLTPKSRGIHLVTEEIINNIPEIKKLQVGLLNLFIQHTSASLTINENFDSSVLYDMENYFRRIVPDNDPNFTHTDEGSDDMTAHIKASIFGSSLSIPINNGKLLLGRWQGIYLCEHRERARTRNLIATIIAE